MSNLTICRTPMKEIIRQPFRTGRWCFNCRVLTDFEFVVLAPTDPLSYYGPSPSVRCAICDRIDADLFPGRAREWDT